MAVFINECALKKKKIQNNNFLQLEYLCVAHSKTHKTKILSFCITFYDFCLRKYFRSCFLNSVSKTP